MNCRVRVGALRPSFPKRLASRRRASCRSDSFARHSGAALAKHSCSPERRRLRSSLGAPRGVAIGRVWARISASRLRESVLYRRDLVAALPPPRVQIPHAADQQVELHVGAFLLTQWYVAVAAAIAVAVAKAVAVSSSTSTSTSTSASTSSSTSTRSSTGTSNSSSSSTGTSNSSSSSSSSGSSSSSSSSSSSGSSSSSSSSSRRRRRRRR